jgi:hypothetical protein
VALLLVAQVPTVTVTTDRACYAPGDQVQVIVHLSDGWTLTGMVWFYIDKPDGHNLYFTYANLSLASATGFVFTLPQDAPEGNYTVTVTHDHDIYIQTTFIVEAQPIPEFSTTHLVLMIAVAVAFAALSGRQASARQASSASHTRARLLCRGLCRICSFAPEQASEFH